MPHHIAMHIAIGGLVWFPFGKWVKKYSWNAMAYTYATTMTAVCVLEIIELIVRGEW